MLKINVKKIASKLGESVLFEAMYKESEKLKIV